MKITAAKNYLCNSFRTKWDLLRPEQTLPT